MPSYIYKYFDFFDSWDAKRERYQQHVRQSFVKKKKHVRQSSLIINTLTLRLLKKKKILRPVIESKWSTTRIFEFSLTIHIFSKLINKIKNNIYLMNLRIDEEEDKEALWNGCLWIVFFKMSRKRKEILALNIVWQKTDLSR